MINSVSNKILMKHNRKLISANLLGTMLEIYDMSIYGYFAPLIASNFFPSSSRKVALINTLAVFMVSFIVRPLGSILFGHLGDTLGRKKTLIITILLMSIATCGIGLLPTTAQIGILAPIFLILFRVIQGLSFSGEFIGSLIFLMEQAPPHQKGYMASWATCGGNIGLLIASILCWALSHFCNAEQLNNWGWRIPFIFATFGGLLCFYLRNEITENVIFNKIKHSKPPLVEVLQNQKKQLIILLFLTCFYMVVCYLIYIWSSTYLIQIAQISISKALAINSVALAIQVLMIPRLAALSDRIGKKPLLYFGLFGLIICIYPYYLLLQTKNLLWIIPAHLTISFIAPFFTSILPIQIGELMPINIRFSGVGFGYNLAGMLVGGTTPLIAMVLIKKSQGTLWLSLYFISWALLAWVALRLCDKTVRHMVLLKEQEDVSTMKILPACDEDRVYARSV